MIRFEKIEEYDDLNTGRKKLNRAILGSEEAVIKSNQAVNTSNNAINVANKAKDKSDTTQQQLDNIIIESGTSDAEVVQARGNHELLYKRLDSTDAQLAETTYKSNMINTENTLFFAHRGMENIAPENTVIAFEYAGQMGLDGIEFDVQDTSDGVWVVMHDDTVDRTTDGSGTIGSMTLSQVKSLNVDSGPYISRYPGTKVPTLEEVLLVSKKWGLAVMLEVKKINNPDNLPKIIKVIKNLGMLNSVKILAPISVCVKMKDLEPNIEYGGFLNSFEDIEQALPLLPYAHVSLEKKAINKEGIDMAHAMGFKVGAWTLNHDDADISRDFKKYGIDYITGTVLS